MKPSQSWGDVQTFLVMSRESREVETKGTSDLYVWTDLMTCRRDEGSEPGAQADEQTTHKTDRAQEKRRELRLVNDLLHDSREHLRLKDVGEREADVDR